MEQPALFSGPEPKCTSLEIHLETQRKIRQMIAGQLSVGVHDLPQPAVAPEPCAISVQCVNLFPHSFFYLPQGQDSLFVSSLPARSS